MTPSAKYSDMHVSNQGLSLYIYRCLIFRVSSHVLAVSVTVTGDSEQAELSGNMMFKGSLQIFPAATKEVLYMFIWSNLSLECL